MTLERITPAHAGKRTTLLLCRCATRDHPRACGEKRMCNHYKRANSGSPPRMRGKGILHPMHCPHGRITPAHAGKRCSQAIRPMKRQDHPRACGEKEITGQVHSLARGSPPRMRGKDFLDFVNVFSERITPAHAGKRQKTSS